MRSLGRLPLLVLGAALSLAAPRARAQDAKTAAHEHFDRALAASNEQRFDDAAREFETAYELAPDFKVLYNIGRVSVLLGRPLRAVEAFEGYLAQGGDRLPEERRGEVRQLIAEQLLKLAALGVETTPGADVRVDGRLVGQAPLAQRVRVTAGPHTVEVLLRDRPPQLREVVLVGASTTDLALVFPTVPTLERSSAATRPPAFSLERQPPPAPERSHRRRVAGTIAGGAGLLALIGGAALAFEGALAANDAKARLVVAANPAPPANPDVLKYDAAKADYDDAKTRNQLGWAIAGVGGLAVVAGAALLIASPAETPSGASHARVVVGPGTAALRGEW